MAKQQEQEQELKKKQKQKQKRSRPVRSAVGAPPAALKATGKVSRSAVVHDQAARSLTPEPEPELTLTDHSAAPAKKKQKKTKTQHKKPATTQKKATTSSTGDIASEGSRSGGSSDECVEPHFRRGFCSHLPHVVAHVLMSLLGAQ